MDPMKIGVIGCGNISSIYFKNLARVEGAQVIACADLLPDRARAAAEAHGIPMVLSVEALLAHPDVQLVVNLTVPKAHAAISLEAARNGKHVYSEKPLGTDRDEAIALMEAADAEGVRVGCAPDTFLGGAHQTCRKLIDDGAIGEVVGATAFMVGHGPEGWHPSPEFFYEVGGGPMMDMGPYYLTSMVNMLGPIRAVTGISRISFAERTITSRPKQGTVMKVETPTHIAGVLDFASGAIGTILMSFDVWHSTLPRIEVYGSEGTLLVPDPNGFGGKALVRSRGDQDWREAELTHGFIENSRGIGVMDMTAAVAENRPHRASGQLALHVLDAMLGVNEASAARCHQSLRCQTVRPAALPADLFPIDGDRWLVNA